MLDLDQITKPVPPTMGKIVHLIEQLQAANETIVISINGHGDLPIRDDGAFQMLYSLVERLEVTEMLRERLAALDAGAPTYTLEEVKEQIRAKYGISV